MNCVLNEKYKYIFNYLAGFKNPTYLKEELTGNQKTEGSIPVGGIYLFSEDFFNMFGCFMPIIMVYNNLFT